MSLSILHAKQAQHQANWNPTAAWASPQLSPAASPAAVAVEAGAVTGAAGTAGACAGTGGVAAAMAPSSPRHRTRASVCVRASASPRGDGNVAPVERRTGAVKRRRRDYEGGNNHGGSQGSTQQHPCAVRHVARRRNMTHSAHAASARARVRVSAPPSTTGTHDGAVVAALGLAHPVAPQAPKAVLNTRRRLRPILKSHTAAAAAAEAAPTGEQAAAGTSTTCCTPGGNTPSPRAGSHVTTPRRVRFCDTAKTFDGPRPLNALFDAVVTSYFEGRLATCQALLTQVAVQQAPSVLHDLIAKCKDLAHRITTSPTSTAAVLPHGGGSVAKLGTMHLMPLLILQGMVTEVATASAVVNMATTKSGAGANTVGGSPHLFSAPSPASGTFVAMHAAGNGVGDGDGTNDDDDDVNDDDATCMTNFDIDLDALLDEHALSTSPSPAITNDFGTLDVLLVDSPTA